MRCSVFPRVSAGALLLAGSLVLAAGGCSRQTTGDVSGKVTLNGAPVTSGRVSFIPESGVPVSDEIRTDGTYTVRGIPVGEALVTVYAPPAGGEPAKTDKPKAGDKAPDPKERPPGSIPQRYAELGSSGLHFTVEKGSNNYYHLDLSAP